MSLPGDPGGADAQGEREAHGKVPIDFGMMWFKGRQMGTGQMPVKKYNRALRDVIAGGKQTREPPSACFSRTHPADDRLRLHRGCRMAFRPSPPGSEPGAAARVGAARRTAGAGHGRLAVRYSKGRFPTRS